MPILGTSASGYVEQVYELAQTFNASGTFTMPAGKTQLAVYAHGSSGAGYNGTASFQFGAGRGGPGGSGGSLAFIEEHAVATGTNFTVTVGSAAARVTAGGYDLINGGATSFGNILTVNGSQSATGDYSNAVGTYTSNLNNVLFASGGVGGTFGNRSQATDQANGTGNNSAGAGGAGGAGGNVVPTNASLPTRSAGGGGGGGGGGGYSHPNSNFVSGAAGGSAGSANAGTGGTGGNGKGTPTRTWNSGGVGNNGAQPSGGGGGGGGNGTGYSAGGFSLPDNGGLGAAGQVLVYVK